MIDLSFLTEAEQEAILKVLRRDADLKKAEDQRVRELQDTVSDENELKYKSGQWFYDAKSKRHRDKIHGADLVRASIRKKKKPATIAELSQSNKDTSQRSWVNSINQDIFIPPELFGVMEPPDETEEDLTPTKAESNQSAKSVNLLSPDTDVVMKNVTASPIRQRKNPFNSEVSVDQTHLDNEMLNHSPEAGRVNGQEENRSDHTLPIIKNGVKLPHPAPMGGRQTLQEAEDDPSLKPRPVPKPRKLAINGQLSDSSNSSLQKEDSFNSTNKRKGILKRWSSSSSTDSESIRIPQNIEPMKLVLPASPILEAEQSPLFEDEDTSSDNSPDRQKQVRFSEKVLQKPPTPNPESYNVREIGEFGILEPSSQQNELDYGFVDYNRDEESKPSQYSYSDLDFGNPPEFLDQSSFKENSSVSLPVQKPSNLFSDLEVEKKLGDPSQGKYDNRVYEDLDESFPEINIDSAGTEPFYTPSKKPSKSTSSDQDKGTEPLRATVKKPSKPTSLDQEKGTEPLHAAVKKPSKPTSSDQEKGTEPLRAAVKKPSKPTSSDQEKGTEPLYAVVKKPSISTSLDQDKDQSQLNDQREDVIAPLESSFPENAEKFKRMSQSVPSILQDETDGRETDSASESSFQIRRLKKSPSSLTNLSGSSGMASMSSVSGSVMSVYSGDFGNVDVKGNIEFAIDYVEQLKEFHIFIYQCKDLAAADVKKQRSDPYVKAYLLPEKAKMGKRKTAVKKKTLNPVYNEILRYKIPKQALQSQTLNLSVWHHDALGRNSFLGEVNQTLATWDWNNPQRNWYPLEPRTPLSGIGLENRGEMKLSLKYIPLTPHQAGKKPNTTGEVHIWIRECIQLPMLRVNKINSFVKCTILPDTSRKSRQKTRTVDKTPNPIFNHTMVYDGFKEDDLREACVELTAWDHNKLTNHFIGGIRVGLGTGKSYGTPVDWMDSSPEESTMWEKMITSPNTWIDGMLPLRMFKMAKLNK